MTAIELEQVFDKLSPHEQHYFRFPDSEMVTFSNYRIVFPKWDKAENRQNYQARLTRLAKKLANYDR